MNIKEIETMYYLAPLDVADSLLGVSYEQQRCCDFSLVRETGIPDWYHTIRVIENRTGFPFGGMTVSCLVPSPEAKYKKVVFGYYKALGACEVPDDSLVLFDKFAVEELGLLPDDEATIKAAEANLKAASSRKK